MVYSFIYTDLEAPIYSGKVFVCLSVICGILGFWVVYRDYKKDEVKLI
jgi:hypothetical protein